MRDQRWYENATDLVEIVQLSLTELGDIWGPVELQRVSLLQNAPPYLYLR